jgi:hypothetical protein
MKKVVLFLLIFMSFKGYSQMKVGINPKSIDSSAMFQVDVNQTAGKAKGLLLPRVPLNSTTDVATILAPATGLVVYAKGGTLAEGLYVWDGAKWQKMSDANLDLDKDSTNEIQKLTFSNNVVKLSKGGDSVNLASLIIDTTSLSNRINTNKQAIIDTASALTTKINTNKQAIIDTATSLRNLVNTHITADLDIDSTNEIQKLTFSNNVVKLSKGGDSVNLASLIIDTTSLSNRINTNKQAIIDTASALTTKINTNKQAIIDTATSLRTLVNTHIAADLDIDSTNEIQKLSLSGNVLKLSKNGDSVSIAAFKNMANNGTSISGDSVVLGGTLDRATTITTSSTNTLAISGLSKATTSDSVLMSSGSTGIVKKISVPELRKLNIAITAATSYTVSDTLDAVIFNGSANTTFTIPAASSCKGKEIRFMNYAKSASNVSITLSAAVVYEGDVSNITHTVINSKMTVYEYPEGLGSQYGNTVTIISDGTDWYKVGM